ncbi:MAG: VPLPA-CTERM sorting domain-containing protein [Thermodesulfobacteriota bacterium]
MKKMVLAAAAALALSGQAAGVQAATIWLSPTSQTVMVGDPVTLQMFMDFTDEATFGGGVDLFYNDAVLDYVSYTPGGIGMPFYDRAPDELPGELNGIGFGHDNGISGPGLVGTLLFNAVIRGTVDITLATNDLPLGEFYSAVDFERMTVDYLGAQVNAVPLPAAGWLLGSGLLGLVGLRRRQDS